MKRTKERKRVLLKQRINELVALIKELCPEAEVTVLTDFRYEDEDAVIKVTLPPERYEEVEAAVTRKETEILWNDGLFILTQFYEKKLTEPLAATKE
ncbi:MAG: hypothetical protein NZ805_04865 [Armatimonadetes bacterium]|nr:hypothetical protein [Armatimonadota bacterium]MDW8027822.1 hypothetical protein [Armatimonadota bacterium]